MDAINRMAGGATSAATDAKALKPLKPEVSRPMARFPDGVGDRPGLRAAEFKGVVRDMASAPPVDAGRVAALKSAITSGQYKPEPARIADAMLASVR